jgi:hypothetical protein
MADRQERKAGKRAAQLAKTEQKNDSEARFFWQCVQRGGGGAEARLSAETLFGTQVRVANDVHVCRAVGHESGGRALEAEIDLDGKLAVYAVAERGFVCRLRLASPSTSMT